VPDTHYIYCRSCGYNLRGNDRNICPECGKSFDPLNPDTFIDPQTFPVRRFIVWIVIFACLFVTSGTILSIINELYYSDGYLDDLGWPFPIYTGRLLMDGYAIHYGGIILNLGCGLIFGVFGSSVLMRMRPERRLIKGNS